MVCGAQWAPSTEQNRPTFLNAFQESLKSRGRKFPVTLWDSLLSTAHKNQTMKQQSRIIIILLSLSVIIPFAGCGKASRVPGLVKCEGTVRWNGNPVEGASVTFHSKSPTGRGGVAMTDAHGKFKTTTLHPDDGIEPGEYIVTVSKKTTVRDQLVTQPTEKVLDPEAEKSSPRGNLQRGGDTYHIPQVYASKDTSGLSAVIPAAGTKDLLFELVGEISNEPIR